MAEILHFLTLSQNKLAIQDGRVNKLPFKWKQKNI